METWFTNPDKIGSYVLLLAAVVAFFRGWIVTGSTYDRVVKERDRYLEMSMRANELLGRASVSGVEIAKIAQTEIIKARAATGGE